MTVENLIINRRSFRALENVPLSETEIEKIKKLVLLAPSCFNNQPWRFVFVRNAENLEKLFTSLSSGNEWAKNASLIIAVFSKEDLDCKIKEREYFLFDTGIATGFLILAISEMGFVAHPIAGFDEKKAKNYLNIPDEYILISLIIVGKHNPENDRLLNEKQKEVELNRPPRKNIEEIIYDEKFS